MEENTVPALRVAPLPDGVHNAQLRELFAPYGASRCSVAFRFHEGVSQPLGWGIAFFGDAETADRAASALDGTAAFGTVIKVKRANEGDVEYVKGKGTSSSSSPPSSSAAAKNKKRSAATSSQAASTAEPMGVMAAFLQHKDDGWDQQPQQTQQRPQWGWQQTTEEQQQQQQQYAQPPTQQRQWQPQQQPQQAQWAPYDEQQQEWQQPYSRGGFHSRGRGRGGRGRGGSYGHQQPQPHDATAPMRQPRTDAIELQQLQQRRPPPQTAVSPTPPVVRELDLNRIGDIRGFPFFVVQCQVACSTPRMRVPVEIAIVAFTVGGGEFGSFHSLVSPGTLPASLAPVVWWQSRRVHGVHADCEQAEKHYIDVWNRMITFLQGIASQPYEGNPPTFYSKAPEQSWSCINWLAKMAGTVNPFPRVQPIEAIIDHVRKLSGGPPLTPDEHNTLFEPCVGAPPQTQRCCAYHSTAPPPQPQQPSTGAAPVGVEAEKPEQYWSCAMNNARAVASIVATGKP